MMQKHKEQQEQIVTQHIQERIRPKFLEEISKLPILPVNNSNSINNNKPQLIRIQSDAASNDGTAQYFLQNSQTGIIQIQTFSPSSTQQFQQEIYQAISNFKNENSTQFAKRIIIDVRSNPGGYIYLGAQTLRFLFPQAGHPIYPVVDQIRTPLNKEYAVLEDYIQRNQMSSAELMVNPENMSVDSQFYTRGGRNRKTTSNEFDKSMEVELTEKYGIYRNQVNRYITLTTNQKWKRQILYNPEDVLIITDGQCASTCSQFLKAIQQKHLARIISVGVKDPRDPNKRQDISYASSGSATNVNSIQSDKSYANYRTIWNTSNIPGKFVRTGTYLGFANRGLYGYNDQSKDQLMEYQIIDPDFRYEVAPNPGETPEYLGEAQKLEFYENILNIESELLGNQQTQQEKKCLSWEVDFVQAASNGDCRGCLRGDQHSVFGYPCTTRGKTEQEGRNIDGTSKIGVFDDEQCVFSHCKVGYYRKNVNVNGTMKDQCVLIPLGYNETRSEMTPDQSEDEISVDDQCGNPCKNITSATPIDTCACPTDPTKLQQDPRKDGLCKCAIITSSTPIDQCACPTDANLLALDPRKDGLCKCAIIVQTTPIDTCACPTERSELDKDPRKDGLCKCAIITSTTPIDTCACPTDSNLLALDPRKEGLCKCAIITSSTPVNTCPCPTDPTKLQQDPRKDGLCKCAIITSTTPIDTCPCPTDSNKLAQDPRKDGLCKCSIITSTTPIDTCPCPTDSNLLAQDPRKDGLCQCAIITSSTPVNTCPCPTDSNLLAQDPRKDGLCKCAIITSSTPIDQCACPTDANLLALDPRKDGLCKCAIIVQTTPIDTCACPTERSELDKDPRKDGLCKCAIITSTTPIDTCACPTDSNLLALDPRKEGLCKCAIITSSTPVSTCPCPTDQSKLQQDPRKDGLCKCAIITSTTSPDTCPCPTELAKDPRQYGICQPEAKFFEYYINKSSGIDRLDRGLSPSSPTRSIGYTIKTLVDSYQYRGSALLNVAADNFSENIEFKSPGHGINTFRLVGTPKDGNNETYPALTNSAHPDQGAIKIIGVGVHVQHFIFAYVPPVSLVSTIQPMISINAGSLSDWNEIASGQRNEIPDHLTQTFTDCIFEGSSVDYNTKKSYGYTIGPFLSIIGSRVTIENCQFNTKDNIQILKGIPSAIISAVFLYPDSGIIINNCNFENLTQSSQVSEAALRETGILNLTGNNKAQQQHLNNLPPSLAIFGIVDSTSSNNSRNAETAQIEVKSTQFINSKGESARCEAVLIDGFALVRNFNDLKNSKSNQLKHKLNNASPLYLPIVNLDGNSFENANEQTNAFVALGSGVRYGLISNNRFVFNNTTSDKETVLINFESAERVTESGGAENIIGSGNTYTTSLIEEGGSDQIQTSGLFTVEGKQDSSFDIQTDSKVTVNIIDTTSDVVEEKDDDIKGKKSEIMIVVISITASFVLGENPSFQSSPKGDYSSPSPSETLAPPLYFEIAKWAAGTGKRTMTQASGQNAQALFIHLRDGTDLNTTPSQPLIDDRDVNECDTNVFASDREITVTDADTGPALRTPSMQEIQNFIMRFMKLLTGRNAFAIDFWANPIAQAQIRNYKARSLHTPEVTRHVEVLPQQVLNNAANSRVDGYIQNLQFQILMLYKITVLSIQHVLEGKSKETLIDLVGKCAALFRFAERSTYIQIQMKKGAQGAEQFDPGYNGVMPHVIQPLHALRLIQGQGSQDLVNLQAGQYSATAMGPGQQIPQLVTFTPIQIVQHFYS
ncbi:MAG: hypothetical protein EZS28_018269 [Streblomastix strix]|uniref:Tail specific protease domain-containing protein n=1 Tax=Streblomastix strix TaxID=222440 RepID=A0A5J4VUZ1_9EUKA|nr:MAG: hypothetical protein EZS28_018269 [Streblomastix strix]